MGQNAKTRIRPVITRGLNTRTLLIGLIMSISLTLFSLPVFSADIAAGKAKAALCVSCHGTNGISGTDMVPNLAGQKAAYLAKAIGDFKSGARKNGMMSSVVPMIADADIENIAAYYASLK